MSEPLQRIKSAENYLAAPRLNFWRIAFKVTDEAYDVSRFDQIELSNQHYELFADEVYLGNSCYDLCRIKGHYHRLHEDFVQVYLLKLFADTPFPCNVLVWVEEMAMEQGKFAQAPTPLYPMSSPHELKRLISAQRKNKKPKSADAKHAEHKNVDLSTIAPDYEIFYCNTPNLVCTPGSVNDLVLSLCCRYLRASPKQRGVTFGRAHAFVSVADGKGMVFFKQNGFMGLVPQLPSASTLVPLVLLTGYSLGLQHCLRHINLLLSRTLCDKLRNTFSFIKRTKRNLRDLSLLYYSVTIYLNQSLLHNAVSTKNRLAQELYQEISQRLELTRYYRLVKEQLEPLTVLMTQLRIREVVKAQSSLRFAIVALGFFMVALVVCVCVILGVEPMVRMLNELGIMPEGFLNLASPPPK